MVILKLIALFPESTNIGAMEATIKDLTSKLADQETAINNSAAGNYKKVHIFACAIWKSLI